MPSPALSPLQQQQATQSGGAGNNAGPSRPPMMKRHSSTGQGASRQTVASPGSVGEDRPLRAHAVGGGRRGHARIQLPRNHSSGRNLNKLGQRAQHQYQATADDSRRHSRQRSHEGDTEIRLPGSLDESRPVIRRNLTAYELPRNVSRTKLKKNLSHGQLTRLNASSKNLAGMSNASHRAPPSPGLKGKSKRPKSADMEKDLHAQEVEIYEQQQQQKRTSMQQQKKVGFAVGSAGDTSDVEDAPDMEGSGLQEDEWTDQSNSASPYSTRQNTANNSRRTSVISPDKPTMHPPPSALQQSEITEAREPDQVRQPEQTVQQARQVLPDPESTPTQSEDADDDTEEDEESSDVMAERTAEHAQKQRQEIQASQQPYRPPHQEQQNVPPHVRSPLHAAKDHPNPVAKRLTSNQLPAPALITSVSTLDSKHNSAHPSPAPSLRSSQTHLGGTDAVADDGGELVSRFMPSASHPQNSTGSGGSTAAYNTPKQGFFQTPEEDSALHRAKSAPFQVGPGPGPVSPGSTISGSSGAATPALGRSRIELRMMHDKALADREEAAERQPLVPHHIYDRRNETLKSYLNLAHVGGSYHSSRMHGTATPPTTNLSLGPEIFQGRFKAVNTELRVVQKFRDPIAEAVARLQKCRGTKLAGGSQRNAGTGQKQAAALKLSKSAVSLPGPAARGSASREPSKLSTSTSPPKNPISDSMARSDSPSKSAVAARREAGAEQKRHPRRGVSFAGTPPSTRPQTRDCERDEETADPDRIARIMWDSLEI